LVFPFVGLPVSIMGQLDHHLQPAHCRQSPCQRVASRHNPTHVKSARHHCLALMQHLRHS
jgi:hypothetical protein